LYVVVHEIASLNNYANGKEAMTNCVVPTVVVENNFIVGNVGKCALPETKDNTPG
jgi:hypothetical protein